MGKLVYLLVIACCTGCGTEERTAQDALVRDSAGVQLVLNNASTPVALQALSLAVEPELRIGAVEGDSLYQFFRITALRNLPDGGVVVANSGTRELRFYDRSGAFVTRTGRDGEGPGEFRGIDRIALIQDSIWVYDPRLSRVSVFTLQGSFARSFSLAAALNATIPRLLGTFADGTLLAATNVTEEQPDGIQPIRSQHFHLDRGGALLDSLGEFESGQHLVQHTERGWSSARVPFGRMSAVATSDSQFYFGLADGYEARLYRSDGQLQRIVRLSRTPQSVAPQDLDRYIDAVAKRVADPNARQRLAALYHDEPLPASMPAYLSFRVDPLGRLWVEEYRQLDDAVARWSIFDRQGKYLGILELPPDFSLYDVGRDFVLGVRTDAAGVEYVERYALTSEAH